MFASKENMNKEFKTNNYKRILLKLSGEALMGDKGFGHDTNIIETIAKDIKEVIDSGLEVSVVVGGGNIYRGSSATILGIDKASGDYIGMLATIMNALILQGVLEKVGITTRVLSAIPMTSICEPYIRRRAKRHLEKGRVVIFAAGSGNPFFTTDTASVLRAIEMNCDILLKGTQVDGIYSADPKKDPTAQRFETITYSEVLQNNLNIMDMAAIALAKDNNLPIRVFSIKEAGNLSKVLKNQGNFTIIKGE